MPMRILPAMVETGQRKLEICAEHGRQTFNLNGFVTYSSQILYVLLLTNFCRAEHKL